MSKDFVVWEGEWGRGEARTHLAQAVSTQGRMVQESDAQERRFPVL